MNAPFCSKRAGFHAIFPEKIVLDNIIQNWVVGQFENLYS
jgi:hypothetical protein